MSISTNSINCGDDFTPAENGEVNGDAINLLNDGQFDGNSESISDKQQLKEFREKFANMEMELKMSKLELENKALEQKLMHQEMMVEQKTLKEKVDKIEQKKEKNAADEKLSQLQNEQKKILGKISALEKQQKEQTKATSKMQNDQMKILERISALEQEPKQRKAFLNFRQNFWDANVRHNNLKIIDIKSLIVHYKRNFSGYCSSVFAKHPILLDNNSSDTFYYEISIGNKENWMSFGFAVKQQNKLDGTIRTRKGTYAIDSDGKIWINGEGKGINVQYSYGVGDIVGIGVNSVIRQIIFTKNGKRLDSSGLLVASSFGDDSFHPFVSLHDSGDKIEANFGPNFKFDLEAL
ncbi:hypothetical protein niasHT_035269 [Heterodera trifolii]|uniref:B30.2/SPRY domain-containing protein n=1 Tax=Heterodera trifolii TaxID=157864 RepID=A0ABD2J485_9BILA